MERSRNSVMSASTRGVWGTSAPMSYQPGMMNAPVPVTTTSSVAAPSTAILRDPRTLPYSTTIVPTMRG